MKQTKFETVPLKEVLQNTVPDKPGPVLLKAQLRPSATSPKTKRTNGAR